MCSYKRRGESIRQSRCAPNEWQGINFFCLFLSVLYCNELSSTDARKKYCTLRPYKHVISLIWFCRCLFFFSMLVQHRTSISSLARALTQRLSSAVAVIKIASIVCGLSLFGCAWQRYRSGCCSVIIYLISLHRTRQAQVNWPCCCLVWWWWRRQQQQQHHHQQPALPAITTQSRQVPVHSIFVQTQNATNNRPFPRKRPAAPQAANTEPTD